MKTKNVYTVYFSATNTTRTIIREIARPWKGEIAEYNITKKTPQEDIIMDGDDLLIVGMPVYAGRIPAIALPALERFKGNDTPAIIVCVYGNRDYDDALLELKDMVEGNGFKVVSAGTFIAQHAIFPLVGRNRPDKKDMELIAGFGQDNQQLIADIVDLNSLSSEISVKGNHPYKVPHKIPLHPRGDRKCDKCGICVKQCPVAAIPADHPRRTDTKLCIACGRCIVVCPQKARRFRGIKYKIAGNRFVKAYAARKESEVIFTK